MYFVKREYVVVRNLKEILLAFYLFLLQFNAYESILATRNMDSTTVVIPSLQFDPDKYPHATLKAFNDFIEQFAQYPEPSKAAVDNAIAKWKASNSDRELSEKDIETVCNEWISKDKVRNLLGFFSSLRLQQDWKAAESNPEILKNAERDYFIERMRQYYKPTENQIIQNFEF